MDVFDFDNVKAEKAKAITRYNRLRTISKLFRLVEICLAFVLLSWISARLPFAVKISGEICRQLIAVIVSPVFVFLISNAIVVTLLAKSGQLSGRSPAVDNAETVPYEEFVNGPGNFPPVPEPEEIVYEDKQIISEVNTITPKSNEVTIEANSVSDKKIFRRSQSENLMRKSSEKPYEKLRRSETEKFGKVVDSGDVAAVTACLVDKLSNEEFQRTIEDFIAKQVKIHHEEKFAIITSYKIN